MPLVLVSAVAMAAALAPAAGAAPPAPVLYGAVGGSSASSLYSIDPATGTGTAIGPIGYAVTGLAQDPTSGTLYGVTSARSPNAPKNLITVDPATGAGTVVGPLGKIIADVSFNSSGQLYGWAEGPDGLASIDKTTGTATLVGTQNLDTYGDGESFDKNDVLFDMGKGDEGPLWTVDTATGNVTTVASLSGSPFSSGTQAAIGAASFACDRTTLYAADNNFGSPPTYLVTVNTSTAAITTVGQTITGLDALEWVCPTQIQLDASAVSVNETAGTATVNVSRLGGLKGAVSVNYATANGTATAGSDYTPVSGTLTFASNETAKAITVPIADDNLAGEPNQTFTLRLSSPTAGATLGTASTTVTIVEDNDRAPAPRLSVAGVRAGCVAANFTARVAVKSTSLRSVRVTLDGHQIRLTGRSSFGVRIAARALRGGTHAIRVVALDRFGTRTTKVRRFTRCAVRAVHARPQPPRFTG